MIGLPSPHGHSTIGTAVYVVGTIDCDWSGLINIALDGNAIVFNRRACSLLTNGVTSLCEYPWFTAANLDPTTNHNLTLALTGPPPGQAPSGHIIADLRYIESVGSCPSFPSTESEHQITRYTAVDPTDTASLASSTSSPASTSVGLPASAASQTSSQGPAPAKHSNAGAIAGGVIAGIVGLLLLIAGIFFCLRRRNRDSQHNAYRDPDLDANPYPPADATVAAPYHAPAVMAETTPWHPGMLLAGAGTASTQPPSSERSTSSKDGFGARYTSVSNASPPPTQTMSIAQPRNSMQEQDMVHRIAASVAEMLRNPTGGNSEPPPEYTRGPR